MNQLTAKEILESNDLPLEKVEVPEWGGYVYVRGLTGSERDRFETMVLNWSEKDRSLDSIRANLVVWTACNEDGERIFQRNHIKSLGKKSAKALNRIYEKAVELSGVSEDDIKELEGNLD